MMLAPDDDEPKVKVENADDDKSFFLGVQQVEDEKKVKLDHEKYEEPEASVAPSNNKLGFSKLGSKEAHDDISRWEARLGRSDANDRWEALSRLAALIEDGPELLKRIGGCLLDNDSGVRARAVRVIYSRRQELTANHLRPHVVGIARGLASNTKPPPAATADAKGKSKSKAVAPSAAAADEARRSEAATLISILTDNTMGKRSVHSVRAPPLCLDAALQVGIPDEVAALFGQTIGWALDAVDKAQRLQRDASAEEENIDDGEAHYATQSCDPPAKRRKPAAEGLAPWL